MISIKESFSSLEELNKIFDHIKSELKIIDERTEIYNRAEVDTKALEEVKIKETDVSFNAKEYIGNFKPDFGKIDRVVHRHNSPGVSSVSYTRVYNGDMPPK